MNKLSQKQTVLAVAAGAIIVLIALFSIPTFKGGKAETIVDSNASDVFGVHGGYLYYQVGNAVVKKSLATGTLEKMADNISTASTSPDGSKLFYQSISNGLQTGKLINLDTAEEKTIASFYSSVWCDGDLIVAYTQEGSSFTLKDSSGKALFRNVPTSDVICLNNSLYYATTQAYQRPDEGTYQLKQLSGDNSVQPQVELQATPLHPAGPALVYYDQDDRLSILKSSGNKKSDYSSTDTITASSPEGNLFALDFTQKKDSVVVTAIDIETAASSVLKPASIPAGEKAKSEEDKGKIGFVDNGYIYFARNKQILRIKL